MVVERKFVEDKLRESAITEYLQNSLEGVGFSSINIKKTPVGFSVIIHSSKPGLIVGRGGSNIKEIQKTLEKDFNLESPVVDVREVEKPELDPNIMAGRVGFQLKRYGASRFKAIGHKILEQILNSGALGAEIRISGRVPSKRARSWKFYGGYLPKCGEVAKEEVLQGFFKVKLKPGVVGVYVKILPPNVRMPDVVYLKEEKKKIFVEETVEEDVEENNKNEEKVILKDNEKIENENEKSEKEILKEEPTEEEPAEEEPTEESKEESQEGE